MTSDAPILAPPAAASDPPDPRRWLTLIILLLAGFMNLLDVSSGTDSLLVFRLVRLPRVAVLRRLLLKAAHVF